MYGKKELNLSIMMGVKQLRIVEAIFGHNNIYTKTVKL